MGATAAVLQPLAGALAVKRPHSPFTFAQLCDPQLGMGGYDHDLYTFRAAVACCNGLNVDFSIICGDLVNQASKKSFADFNRIKAEFVNPCYCAAGNHDVGNKPTAASLHAYRDLVGKDYFAFTHKGFSFVVANTQLWKSPIKGESEKHDNWLRATLKSESQRGHPVFVVLHYPLFLKSPEEEEVYFNLPVKKRIELLHLFQECGVVAVLAGHTHRTIINQNKEIQFVNGESTSKTFDKRPLGFRVWHVVNPRLYEHTFVPIKNPIVPTDE